MPVFISYSHADGVFATRLASQLVKHKANVWIDQWELHVGDSLIQRIQDAIQGAIALLVILSKASVQSEWCKKELSTGLIRELDEKRVVVLATAGHAAFLDARRFSRRVSATSTRDGSPMGERRRHQHGGMGTNRVHAE